MDSKRILCIRRVHSGRFCLFLSLHQFIRLFLLPGHIYLISYVALLFLLLRSELFFHCLGLNALTVQLRQGNEETILCTSCVTIWKI